LLGKIPFTTAPAATTQLSPIIEPSKKVTFAPIQTLLPIFIPLEVTPCSLINFDVSLKL
jgi:hypothetical protein